LEGCPTTDRITPLERVMAAINLSKADRVPVVPQITYATSQLLGIRFHEAMTDASLMVMSY